MYIPSNITTPELIHKELEEIQAFLESKYAADQPAQVQSRFDSLGAYMARSGKLLADSTWHYNTIIESAIMESLIKGYEEKLSASTINKYVESVARGYKFLMVWSDRVNRSCTHQMEATRTVMSNLRSERNYSNYSPK